MGLDPPCWIPNSQHQPPATLPSSRFTSDSSRTITPRAQQLGQIDGADQAVRVEVVRASVRVGAGTPSAQRGGQGVRTDQHHPGEAGEWGAEQLGEAGRPWGLEYAADGNLYVIDGADMLTSTPDVARITKLSLEGEVLETWSSYGAEPGQLSWGHDIDIDIDIGIGIDIVRVPAPLDPGEVTQGRHTLHRETTR